MTEALAYRIDHGPDKGGELGGLGAHRSYGFVYHWLVILIQILGGPRFHPVPPGLSDSCQDETRGSGKRLLTSFRLAPSTLIPIIDRQDNNVPKDASSTRATILAAAVHTLQRGGVEGFLARRYRAARRGRQRADPLPLRITQSVAAPGSLPTGGGPRRGDHTRAGNQPRYGGLDACWEVLRRQTEDGTTRAWLSLCGAGLIDRSAGTQASKVGHEMRSWTGRRPRSPREFPSQTRVTLTMRCGCPSWRSRSSPSVYAVRRPPRMTRPAMSAAEGSAVPGAVPRVSSRAPRRAYRASTVYRTGRSNAGKISRLESLGPGLLSAAIAPTPPTPCSTS